MGAIPCFQYFLGLSRQGMSPPVNARGVWCDRGEGRREHIDPPLAVEIFEALQVHYFHRYLRMILDMNLNATYFQ